MIVPTRFGLKFAPVPTLALEYEDDLNGVVDATGESASSLYVYRDASNGGPPARKLHVVELPMLTRTSETQRITRQLQQDNGRFLAPAVVSEAQLKRLLDRLVQNLPAPPAETSTAELREPSLAAATEAASERRGEVDASESELEESAMEESVAEASCSDEHEVVQSAAPEAKPNRGAFLSHEESDEDAEKDATTRAGGDESGREERPAAAALPTKEEEEEEAAEDTRKTKALRSDSDVSEEDVQSEELEYFSEDGSDEDSF
jgi:hypothetical protein